MPINFFETPCAHLTGNCLTEEVRCMQPIQYKRFGVSDANANDRLPAKIVFEEEHPWDFTVVYCGEREVRFKAIDYCVEIFRTGNYDLRDDHRDPLLFSTDSITPNGQQLEGIKRCEGFFLFDDKILFFEIKTGLYGAWLKDAREKFEETILSFREHHPDSGLTFCPPVIANKNYYKIHQSLRIQNKILNDKTGLELSIQSEFIIQ